MQKRTFLSPEDDQAIRAEYESGASTRQIAEHRGIAKPTVNHAVRRAGGTLRPPKRPADKKIPVPDLLERYANGEPMEALARRFDVSRWAIEQRLRANGVTIERRRRARGPNHFAWKGGRSVHPNGYVLVWLDPDDPLYGMANGDGYCYEHRLVMARTLGRALRKDESVHHLDGNRQNNSPENLELRRRYHGKGHHAYCVNCGSSNIAYR